MKNKLNNAMTDISDKLIEEAARADRLENNTARIIRNITIPVASVAAIAGLCFGLHQIGVFGKPQGVDLVASSSPSDKTDSASSDIILPEPDKYEFPKELPLTKVSDGHIIGMKFDELHPEMIYADERTAVFTDGAGCIFYYDFEEEDITYSADVYEALINAGESIPDEGLFTGEIGFTAANATANENHIYCYFPYNDSGSGNRAYYYIDTTTNSLVLQYWDLIDVDLYCGLQNVRQDVYALSEKQANIEGTDKFVFIRNSSADYDLLPTYAHEKIELMIFTNDTATSEPTEGGYLPFDDFLDDKSSLDIPETGNSKAALCDRILAANEPSAILEDYAGYSFSSYNSETNIAIDGYVSLDNINADSTVNRFDPEGMGLCDVTDADGRYCVSFVSSADENSEYRMKYVYVDPETLLVEKIEYYNCYADEKQLQEILQMVYDTDRTEDTQNDTDVELAVIMANAIAEYGYDETPADMNDMLWPLYEDYQFITTYFGYDEWKGSDHSGIDIASDEGSILDTPVFAVQDGRVLIAKKDGAYNGGWGNYAVIDHGNGYVSIYTHCNEVGVEAGDYIERGANIATVGSTGWSTGPHLHFEIRKDGEAINPFDFGYSYVAEKTGVIDVIAELDAMYNGDYILPENTAWCLDPEYTTITETIYGNGGYYGHNGVDIYSPVGMPIYAMADGEVVFSDWWNGYGYCIAVQHSGGYFTLYAHASSLHAKVGDKVTAGQFIASTGSTGYATGSHLHLEVLKGTENVDPFEMFPEEYLDKVTYSEDAFVFNDEPDEICGYPTAGNE